MSKSNRVRLLHMVHMEPVQGHASMVQSVQFSSSHSHGACKRGSVRFSSVQFQPTVLSKPSHSASEVASSVPLPMASFPYSLAWNEAHVFDELDHQKVNCCRHVSPLYLLRLATERGFVEEVPACSSQEKLQL